MRGAKVDARGTPIQRFWAKTEAAGGCIIWIAGVYDRRPGKEYGVFSFNGRSRRAHRWIYEQVVGPLPPDVLVMHSCDNPRCVKLQHLSPGTDATNVADAVSKGRNSFGERHSTSKLTESQVDRIRERRGSTTLRQLASEYGVSGSHISRIVNGKQRRRRKEK